MCARVALGRHFVLFRYGGRGARPAAISETGKRSKRERSRRTMMREKLSRWNNRRRCRNCIRIADGRRRPSLIFFSLVRNGIALRRFHIQFGSHERIIGSARRSLLLIVIFFLLLAFPFLFFFAPVSKRKRNRGRPRRAIRIGNRNQLPNARGFNNE